MNESTDATAELHPPREPVPEPGEIRVADAAEEGAAPPPARRRRGCWFRLFQAALILIALLAVFALYQWITWPDVEALVETDPTSSAFIDAYKRKVGADPQWQWVPYSRISNHLKHAVVVAEDMDFFSHEGFAWEEIKKAVEEARAEKGIPRGASTISQQVAKNLWLSPSRNPWRKAKEAWLTKQLEEHLEKRRILEIYLNVAQFGPGIYGAEAAARHYYGKPAANLSAREAAALASGLPQPSNWHPQSDSKTYQRRVNTIYGRMRQSGWVRGEL